MPPSWQRREEVEPGELEVAPLAEPLAWMIWRLPAVDGPWTMVSLTFPAFYLALSLWLQFRR